MEINLINTNNIDLRSSSYKIYSLTFPNGDVYYGKAKTPVARWRKGKGYLNVKYMNSRIRQTGWDNIVKTIITEFDDIIEALEYETSLICNDPKSINHRRNTTMENKLDITRYLSKLPLSQLSIIKYIDSITQSRTKTVDIDRNVIDDDARRLIDFIMQHRDSPERSMLFPATLISRSSITFFNDQDWKQLMSK